MRIGIMTYWSSKENYGQLLQCFALQQFLKKMGHSPFLIKYNSTPIIRKKNILQKFISYIPKIRNYHSIHD